MLRSLVLPHSSTEETWREIERLVEEIAALAETDLTAERFYSETLERAQQVLAGDCAAVWVPDEDGTLHCLARTGQDARDRLTWERAHRERAAASWQRGGGAQRVPTRAACHLYAPVLRDQQRIALLQVDLPSETSVEVQESGLHLLRTICELVADYDRRTLVRELRGRVEAERQWRGFLAKAHAELDLESTAYCVANEGRLAVECDTLSVLVRRGRRCRAVAVSGVDALERRAHKVRALEALAAECARQQQSLWWPEKSVPLPPETEEALEAYLDESHAKQLGVVPITEPCDEDFEVAAVIVAEDASARLEAMQFRAAVQTLAELSTGALIQSIRFRRTPFSRWLWSAGRRRSRKDVRKWSWVAVVTGVALALVAMLAFVPARLRVPAGGTLQPKHRRHVFAPEFAIVDEVLVKHGQKVYAGEALVQLSKPELALETTRIVGELQVARQQLQSVRAKRFLPQGGASGEARLAAGQLAAEEQRWQQQVESLDLLLKRLRDREQALRLLSPLEGQVLTWDTERLLASRPVQTGQKLLTVADPNGPWILELRVNDRDAHHMLEARRSANSPLPVRFSLGTNPEAAYEGRVVEIAQRSELAGANPPTVKVIATFDEAHGAPLRAGSEVVARIDCGSRSLGYVWLHDLWDALAWRLFY